MARKICRTLLALALLYAAAIGLFALIHYKGMERPDVGAVVVDFHRWAGGLFRPEHRPDAPPGALPAPAPPPEPGGPSETGPGATYPSGK